MKTLAPEFIKVQTFSPAEYEIFLLLGDGLSTREVAKKIFRSPKTVESHMAHIREKLSLERSVYVRCLAAKFQAFYGRPKMQREPIQRKLLLSENAPSLSAA